jgi:phospholipase C
MPEIQHVFVLMLENRSFDHLLGNSALTGTDAETQMPTKLNGLTGSESNRYNGKSYGVSKAADGPANVDPGHEFPDVVEQLAGAGVTFPHGGPYPPVDGSGYVAAFMRTAGEKAKADPGEIMRCLDPSQLPVLVALAGEFAVCDSWFSSMPGPTLPNRFFLLAGSSGGLDHSPTNAEMLEELAIDGFPIRNGTIFQQPLTSRIYCGGVLCMSQTLKGVNFTDVHHYSNFAADVSSASRPYGINFTLIEPDYGDVTGTFLGGTSQHPMDGITGGERLIHEVYESIRSSPVWAKSLLIVLWDEHGGFYDHVLPPAAVAPGDLPVSPKANQYGFEFTQYGPRVAAVIVSPLIPRNLIDHRLYDHSSVLATIQALFGLPPLTRRDANARNLLPLASLAAPRATPERLPQPAAVPDAPAAAPDKSGPADAGNVPAFLAAALRSDLHLSPPHHHGGILARVKSLTTLAHADQYIQEVGDKVRALAKGRSQGNCKIE